jgi:hypothetical protein
MNLFELNARLAVKLGQSLETLYDLEYMEYSLLLNIVKKDVDEANETALKETGNSSASASPVKVNLPDHLKLK